MVFQKQYMALMIVLIGAALLCDVCTLLQKIKRILWKNSKSQMFVAIIYMSRPPYTYTHTAKINSSFQSVLHHSLFIAFTGYDQLVYIVLINTRSLGLCPNLPQRKEQEKAKRGSKGAWFVIPVRKNTELEWMQSGPGTNLWKNSMQKINGGGTKTE